MEDIVAIILLFGGGMLFLLSISPVGRAVADRIRARGHEAPRATQDLELGQQAILEELGTLRRELTEVQERLDFTERMLARERDAGRLPGPRGVEE